MRLQSLDLNLLLALHALLEERNVTRAGQRIGLSQPAASASLARLRRHFDDELLVRVGNGYELTPLAVGLADPVALAVGVVDRVFAARPTFDPNDTDREFTLVISDYALSVISDTLMATLEREAPRVKMNFLQINVARVDDIAATLRSVDGLIMPHGFVSGYPALDLYSDEWVIIADRDNAEIGDSLTMADLATLPWAITFRTATAITAAARQLIMLGVEPRIDIVVENFQSLPFLITGTRRIALVQKRLADRMAALATYRVLQCPFDALPIVEAFWYHPLLENDSGHRWLRDLFFRVGGAMAGR